MEHKIFFQEVNGKATSPIFCKQLAENKINKCREASGLQCSLSAGNRAATEAAHKLQHQASEQRNMFRGGMTPVLHRTTEVSYQISHKVAKAMAPLQHGELFKDCLVQSTLTLFPEKADILRTVQQVPLSRNACTGQV